MVTKRCIGQTNGHSFVHYILLIMNIRNITPTKAVLAEQLQFTHQILVIVQHYYMPQISLSLHKKRSPGYDDDTATRTAGQRGGVFHQQSATMTPERESVRMSVCPS